MPSILKNLRLLADPSRLRILLLVEREELSVAELQEILGMGQSRISTHLAHLKQAGLVEDRRNGKSILYRLKALPRHQSKPFDQLLAVLRDAAHEIPEAEQDSDALRLALRRRQDKTRSYFDELAGKFGRHYMPGRSWKGLAETLLALLPPLVVADLGAGEGTFSQLLARRAKKVIAVDDSEKMVEYGSELARKHGVENLEYRKGDLEDVPLRDASVDLAFFSQSLHHAQHPERAVAEAWRILKPGGRIVVLDLIRHNYEEAREMYADLWLGFTEVEALRFLRQAG
ncbi:MAG TPA: metalloregulator ArsR/SmtB family transcription factor, partial [Bryobacteraceae bacterium]|nr:metalloregulator ArsR/SmtB family transcription factor [Bryobacteraceae bacterium]